MNLDNARKAQKNPKILSECIYKKAHRTIKYTLYIVHGERQSLLC